MRRPVGLSRLVFVLAPLVSFLEMGGVADADDYLSPAPPKKLALVIGNNDYKFLNDIPSARLDSDSVANSLGALGFTISSHSNVAGWRDFELTILPAFVRDISEGDFVVFYFSGHGFSHGPHSMLAYTDQPLTLKDTEVAMEALSVEALEDLLVRAKPGVLLIILDACRSIGSFVIEERDGTRGVNKGLSMPARFHKVANVITSYATRPGAIATGSTADGSLSIFTEALIRRLPEKDKDFNRLFNFITADVLDSTDEEQVPGLHDYSMTDPYLDPPAPVIDAERASWQSAMGTASRRVIQNFLRLNSVGYYAAAARRWLENNPNEDHAQGFTRVSPAAVDRAWSEAAPEMNVVVERIEAPIAFDRTLAAVAAERLGILPPDDIGSFFEDTAAIATDQVMASMTNNAFVAHGQVVATADVIARVSPSFDAEAVPVRALTRLDVVDVITSADSADPDSSDSLWVDISSPLGGPAYIPLGGDAVASVVLGKPLLEVEVSELPNLRGLVESAPIENAIKRLRDENHSITWASIAGGPVSGDDYDKDEGTALRSLRLANAQYLLNSADIESTRITVVEEQSDVPAGNVRVRFFGH